MLDTTIILGVAMFTVTVLLLVMLILFARSRLVSTGGRPPHAQRPQSSAQRKTGPVSA